MTEYWKSWPMRQTNRPLSMQFSEFHNKVELNDVVIQQQELSNMQRNAQLAWLCSGKGDTDRMYMEQNKINSKATGITSQYLYAFYENESYCILTLIQKSLLRPAALPRKLYYQGKSIMQWKESGIEYSQILHLGCMTLGKLPNLSKPVFSSVKWG